MIIRRSLAALFARRSSLGSPSDCKMRIVLSSKGINDNAVDQIRKGYDSGLAQRIFCHSKIAEKGTMVVALCEDFRSQSWGSCSQSVKNAFERLCRQWGMDIDVYVIIFTMSDMEQRCLETLGNADVFYLAGVFRDCDPIMRSHWNRQRTVKEMIVRLVQYNELSVYAVCGLSLIHI